MFMTTSLALSFAFPVFQYSTFSFMLSRSVLLLCRTYRGSTRTQPGSGSEGSCVMRFKLIPQLSETLRLLPLLGHAVLMAAVPLLTHTMQTHSLQQRCGFFVFLTLRYKMRFQTCNREVGVSGVFSICAALLCHVMYDTTPLAGRTGLNFMHGFNLFLISVCLRVYTQVLSSSSSSFCSSFSSSSCTACVGLRCSSEHWIFHVLRVIVRATEHSGFVLPLRQCVSFFLL